MKEFKAEITIDAPKAKVWEVLTKTEDYPKWDPYCDKIEGTLGLGNKLKAYTKLSPGRAFGVKVTRLDPEAGMTWSGGMPLGLFKGERTFTLEPQGDKVRFELREVFSGPMLALIGKSLPDMTEPFQRFVEGLQAQCQDG